MEQQTHIDKALAFMESLEKLGSQLKAAEEQQKHFIARMLELKRQIRQKVMNMQNYPKRARACKTS